MTQANPNPDSGKTADTTAEAEQRRHDELCERFAIPDEDRDKISFHECCNCDTEVPCEADYVPYAPNGLLWCRDCLEARGGWCDMPYGAVVRDLEPDKKKIDVLVNVTDAEYNKHGRNCIAHAIANTFADNVRTRIGNADVHVDIDIKVLMFKKVEMTLRIDSESRAAQRLATYWVSEGILDDDPSSVLEVFDDVADGTYDGDHYDDDYRRAPLPFELLMIET